MSKKIYGFSKRNWKCFFAGFVLAWLCAGGCCAAFAGVPVKFTVETSRADVQEVQCYHGETLDFDVTFKNYGKDLIFDPSAEAQIFWQTNGMSAFYWRTNNVNVVSNRMTATFLPEMDPGANTVFGFIGIPGDIYRASFVLRLKQSPGVEPKDMEWPYRELDFAKIEMKNVPFYFKEEVERLIEEAKPEDYEEVKSKAESAIQVETDPTIKPWAKADSKPNYTASEVGAVANDGNYAAVVENAENAIKYTDNYVSLGSAEWFIGMLSVNQVSVIGWDNLYNMKSQTLPSYLASGEWNTGADRFVKRTELEERLETKGVITWIGDRNTYLDVAATLGANYLEVHNFTDIMASGRPLTDYLVSGEWNTSTNPFAKLSDIPEAYVPSASDPAFSNAVLAVGAAIKPEYEDIPSNVVWRIEAEGGRFFFKPVRPISMEN